MVVGEDAGGAQGVQRALFGPMVLTEQHNAMRLGAGNVGMAGQIGLGEGPEGVGVGSGAGDGFGEEVLEGVGLEGPAGS